MKNKTSIIILVIAAVLLEATSLVQYWFAREGLREEVVHRAQSELKVKSLTIQNATVAVETAMQNMVWTVETDLQYPDSMYSIIRRILDHNENIVGCGVMFEPNFYPSQGYWFEAYGARRANGEIEMTQLGNANHDYTKMEFYTVPMQTGKPYWCEPYLDSDGARMMLTTYSLPVHDKTGRMVGVFAADVSLDWMNEFVNAKQIYPNAYNVVISRKGRMMVAQVETLVMKYTAQEIAEFMEDTTYKTINADMMAGKSGQASVIDRYGEKNYVFYAPIEGNTGWSMAVAAPDKDIYGALRQVAFHLFLLMLAGLVLIGVILSRSARNLRRLNMANAEKERIGSELRIASTIQRGMLPSVFPPYPERTDIDVYATLDPAKEVGGDLFDFFLRDEKLFFCIGDVSGKGVPASLVMAVTRSLFRNISAHEDSPKMIVRDMNNSMSETNEDNMFVTLFVGMLDLTTGKLHYTNAGHCAPLLVNKDVQKLAIDSNVPVGLMNGWEFSEQEIQLPANTTIFLYTDGIIEAEDLLKRLFGEERMMEGARRAVDLGEYGAAALVKSMGDTVQHFVRRAPQSDDLTMLAVQYIGK